MQPDAGDAEIAAVEARIGAEGLAIHVSRGTERTLIGAVGDERRLSPAMFESLPCSVETPEQMHAAAAAVAPAVGRTLDRGARPGAADDVATATGNAGRQVSAA